LNGSTLETSRCKQTLSKKQKTAGAAASAKRKAGCPPITETTRKKTAVAAATAKQFTPNASGKASRLCGKLNKYKEQLASLQDKSYGLVCAWCGGKTYKNVESAMLHCITSPTEACSMVQIVFNNYHNSVCFGLARGDEMPLHGKMEKDWKEPSRAIVNYNAAHIRKIIKISPDV
jgi:hypothetical protein